MGYVVAIKTRQQEKRNNLCVCVCDRTDIETVVLNSVLTTSREGFVGFPWGGACEDKQV